MNRKEYLDTVNPFDFNSLEGRKFSYKLHCDYYSQFAKASAKGYLLVDLTKEAMSFNKISASLCEIPLKKWDALHYAAQSIFDARKLTESEYPDYVGTGKVVYSLSDTVSIAKTIIRNYMIENGFSETWERNEFGHFETFLVK